MCFEWLHTRNQVYRIVERQDGMRRCFDVEMRYYHHYQRQEIIQYAHDVSSNIRALQKLVNTMNRENLSPEHFFDVIEDFCQDSERIL